MHPWELYTQINYILSSSFEWNENYCNVPEVLFLPLMLLRRKLNLLVEYGEFWCRLQRNDASSQISLQFFYPIYEIFSYHRSFLAPILKVNSLWLVIFPVHFQIWDLELIALLVVLVSVSRYILLKTWPSFAESSEAANEQVYILSNMRIKSGYHAPAERWAWCDHAVTKIFAFFFFLL